MLVFKGRDEVSEWAAGLFDSGFVILDLETTGLTNDPQVAVVEIGVIDQQGEVVMETLVKPGRRIPSYATRIHGISNRDVAAAPAYEKIYPELAAALKDRQVVAYNSPFELGILSAVHKRLQLAEVAPAEWHCAMRAYQRFAGSRYWMKLGVACSHEGVLIENAHRAMGDCRMTLALMRKMAGIAG